VDGDARPVGWLDRQRPGRVLGLGATFIPESDTLRNALDSALTSPFGLAVAVEKDTRRFAGVVTAREILEQVKGSRAAVAESISIRGAEAARGEQAAPVADPRETTGPETTAPPEAAAPSETTAADEAAKAPEDQEADRAKDAAGVDDAAEPADVDRAEAADGSAHLQPVPSDAGQHPQPAAKSAADDDDDVTAVIDKVGADDTTQAGAGGDAAEADRENDVTVVSGEPVDLASPRTDDEKDPVR
jgi:osmoprotectant transport system ATP-binding protein